MTPVLVGRGRPRHNQAQRRSRTYWLLTPATRITLFRLAWPEAMVTEDRGTFKSLAKNSMQASLARPSAGALVKETLSAWPSSPVIDVFFARGWTLTAKVAPSGPSLTGIIERCQCLARQNVVRTKNKTRAIPIET